MKREIKFRAWNGQVMEYSIIVGTFGAFWVNPMKNKDGLDENDTASLTPLNTKCSETTVIMQYTGLKDIKGKEIYEHDVFRKEVEKEYGDDREYLIVLWIPQRAAFYLVPIVHYPILRDNDNLEEDEDFYWLYNDANLYDFVLDSLLLSGVIGNIHEQPELFTKL